MSKKFPQVVLDVSIAGESTGRITFELFTDLTPKTAENFRGLCTGEYGNTGQKKKLHYKGSKFHRIIDGFVVQGGDIVNGDGTGNVSIYGGSFNDENFTRRHACAGLLSMANAGRNSNGCQFFITLKACPHLDGKHVVFGQVIDGMNIVRKMAKVPVDINDKPKLPVSIMNCDEIGDARNYIRNDPFSKEHQLIVKKSELEKEKEDIENLEEQEKQKIAENLKKIEEKIKALDEKKAQEDQEVKKFANVSQKLSQSTKDRLLAIQLKMNEAKNLNTRAVLEEERKSQDPNYERNKKLQKFYEKREEKNKIMEAKGLDSKQSYLNQTASQAEFQKLKQKPKGECYGWNVFNSDTLYRAYDKRCKGLKLNEEHYKNQKENPDIGNMEEGLNRLSEDMEKQQQNREKFSKRRRVNPDEKIDYINERNRVYNSKLNRAFDPYVEDIRSNLENKTAQN